MFYGNEACCWKFGYFPQNISVFCMWSWLQSNSAKLMWGQVTAWCLTSGVRCRSIQLSWTVQCCMFLLHALLEDMVTPQRDATTIHFNSQAAYLASDGERFYKRFKHVNVANNGCEKSSRLTMPHPISLSHLSSTPWAIHSLLWLDGSWPWRNVNKQFKENWGM